MFGEYLPIQVARQIRADDVLQLLAELFVVRGSPEHLRSDNGPEFCAQAVRDWLGRIGVTMRFIEPGSPWENGYVESFIGKLRDELLTREIFTPSRRRMCWWSAGAGSTTATDRTAPWATVRRLRERSSHCHRVPLCSARQRWLLD